MVGNDGVRQETHAAADPLWVRARGYVACRGIGIDDGTMHGVASHALGDRGGVADSDHRRWQLVKRVHRSNVKGFAVQFCCFPSFCVVHRACNGMRMFRSCIAVD